jgi:alkylation response protein AidB-like acyl-CoA dehydrogenase
MEGVDVKPMKCTGLWASGTSFIKFNNVKVPVENMIGKENQGFKYIMFNFNHERFYIIVQSLRGCRICFEESFQYAMTREAFGKKLIDNILIREKLGNMLRKIESTQNWVESMTYQMNRMSHVESNEKLGGQIALLKSHVTKVLRF